MAETVVDDLEAVEVEIERRESAAAGPFLELFEAAPEPLDEDRAVAKPGQRIEESGAMKRLLCDRFLGRSGQRSCDAGRAPSCASHRDAAAQKSPVRAVLVADPMLVLKVIGGSGDMRFERLAERSDVFGVNAAQPFLGATDAGGRGQAHHRLPAARCVERLRSKIPLPQSVVRAFRRERQPFFASFQCLFGVQSIRRVVP